MKEELITEIIASLPKGRTKYYYFKDRYALMLLHHLVGAGRSLRSIRASDYGKLLHRPLVREILKKVGNGRLSTDAIGSVWPADYRCYLLTLDRWGDREGDARFFNQTSRPGWNLVLQLNFSSRHDRGYRRLVKPKRYHPFKCYGHPIETNRYHTQAWARLDLDLGTNEALIEEIQNDWIRYAVHQSAALAAYEKRPAAYPQAPYFLNYMACNAEELGHYMKFVLGPHIPLWEEAMLSAAIWFLREEIGIDRIYYHTFDFGCQLKRIDGDRPPRSLYTRLPERFCFRKTCRSPSFLEKGNNRRGIRLLRKGKPCFYLLDLSKM